MNKLVIKNTDNNIEIVNNSIILKLYELALASEGNTVELEGNLLVDKCKQNAYDYLTGPSLLNKRFPNLNIHVTVDKYISFLDPEVERILLANNIGDGIGITQADAANATIGTGDVFRSNTSITTFDEFLYFTKASYKSTPQQFCLGCTNLESIIYPPQMETVGAIAHESNTSLTSIDFRNTSLTTINSNAFESCTSLTTVLLPSTCTTLNSGAFYGCTNLSSIDLSNVTSIGNNTFNLCSGLTSVNISSCTSLSYSVFRNCTGLTSVTLGNNITSIPKGTFYGCTSLSSIDLSNITSINGDYEAEPFKNCTSLTTVNLSNVRHFGRGCFKGCSNLGLNLDLEITTTDTAWSGEEFQGTKYRTAVVHGPNLTTWISRSVYSSFYNMPNLTLLDLSDTVITDADGIGNGNNLVTIVYPSTLNYIPWGAWGISQSTFKYFIILATTPPSYENVTYCKLTYGNFYVPDSAVNDYKTTWPSTGYQSWDITSHILPLSSLPVGVWKTGLYQLYEPYLSNSSDPAYATT